MSTPNQQKMEGSWKTFKGKLQEAWGALKDDDIDRYEGRREQLIGHIQKKTGETRNAIRRKMDELVDKARYRF